MELLHFMAPEDEIFLCGAAMLYGVVVGVVLGLIAVWKQHRRTV